MEIKSIKIKNFRLLKDFSIDLEETLSLVIGKNNTGKTSILTLLDKFLNSSDKMRFSADDLNVDLKKQLTEIIKGTSQIVDEVDYKPLGIELTLYIEYNEDDDLSQVSPLIMSLDPDDKNIVLNFRFDINYDSLVDMKARYQQVSDKYDEDASLFLKDHLHDYFGSIKKRSLYFDDHTIFTDIEKENINLNDVLVFEYISAKRSVTNKDNDKTLSSQTSRIYRKISETEEQEEIVDKFKKKLRDTDSELNGIYKDIFSSLLEKVNKFGGVKKDDTDIRVASTLQHRELLDGNTTVLYSHDTHDLPEHYNGLGYMNLISMIFDIEMLMAKLRRSSDEKPASINLLFIEEPEAHTHPQMQYVFINNIKTLLNEGKRREDGCEIHLQTIITTHSSHIVSESKFDDIKYLKKDLSENSVISKNLSSLKEEYTSEDKDEDEEYQKYFKFLKQYLTLHSSELFFADKVIFIEGNTERVLLPAMIKKIDQEGCPDNEIPLLSQNISIIEVGAHSKTFEKFIKFIGIKALIITDIDSYFEEPKVDSNGDPELYANGNPKFTIKHCTPIDDKASKTSNHSLLYFHDKSEDDLAYFVDLPFKSKSFVNDNSKWEQDENGYLLLVYQIEENGYCGRSFEDAFFYLNKPLLGNDQTLFPSLTKKWFDKYIKNDIDPLEFSEKAVGSKPSLAIEILLNSDSENDHDYTNWLVPKYIKEGLEWLRKD